MNSKILSFDVNILVNGSRCKQYIHEGKTFIEAKPSSEYTIEIKNNEYGRILACCSVDGLNVINGKSTDNNGPGYIIDKCSSLKIDGYRVSDESVAKFVFSEKENSYAASKEDGSDSNVGIIGVRLFRERFHYNHVEYYDNTGSPSFKNLQWHSSINSGGAGYLGGTVPSTNNDTILRSLSNMSVSNNAATNNTSATSMMLNCNSFDMGTSWGKAKQSNVVKTTFEIDPYSLKHPIAFNIYYASRQSLIDMGIDLTPKKKVCFPKAFKNEGYAEPPKNWKG